ncbi:MAG TPA: serine/threonine-protein kinase [Kofleriaceae bacterium]|nr:serine/threonine-protein kinase [Kofleriaceae bacterium]
MASSGETPKSDTRTLTTHIDDGVIDDAPVPPLWASRYDAGDEIGRGGGGRVLRADDLRLGRPVALKLPLSAAPGARARLEREARVMARLEHPAIVPVHDAGRLDDGTPYYAMKLLGGRTLRDVVRDAGSLDARLVLLPNALTVCEAIAYAHARRVIHRDLKPANVLIGAFGETVVIDWGLAKDLAAPADEISATDRDAPSGDRTAAGAVLGTPQYMPPEQARGEPVDERADVYALGALLYDVLAGAPPYDASGPGVLARVLAGPPPPLATSAPGAPLDLIAIVERAMAREPRDRYPSAKELADDLRRFLAGRLVAAHRYSLAALVRRWIARHRGAVAIGAVAIAAIAIVAVISARRVIDERDHAEREREAAAAARARAETQRAGAEELIDFMLFDLRDRLKPIGKLDALGAVGEKVDDYYRRVAPADRGDDRATVHRRARAMAILGDVALQRGDLDAAERAVDASLALGDPDDLIATWLRLGDVYEARARVDDASAAYKVALGLAQRKGAIVSIADAHAHLGRLADDRGDQQTKTAEYAQVEALLAPRAGDDTDGMLAVAIEKLGDVSYDAGDYAAAQAAYEDELAVRRRVLAAHPDDARARRGFAQTTMWIGMMKMERGQLDAAAADYATAGAIFRALIAQDPDNVEWLRDAGLLEKELATLAYHRHDKRGALDHNRAALDLAIRIAARSPDHLDRGREVAMHWIDVGESSHELGDRAAALAAYRSALAILDPLAASDPGNLDWLSDRGEARAMLAGELGTGAEATRLAVEARAILDELRAKGQDNPEVRDLAERVGALDALR